MRNAVRVVCLTVVLVIAVSVLMAPSCEATSVTTTVEINLDLTGGGDPELYVKEKEKFFGLCRNKAAGPKKRCGGNEIKWTLKVTPASSWQTDDEVIIFNAPGYPMCFGADPVETFTDPSQEFDSGIPAFACTNGKFGTYWPYIIEFYRNGTREATTDPGAVIFP